MAPHGAPAAVARRIVMVVDDSLTVRRVTQRLLDAKATRSCWPRTASMRWSICRRCTPDLMLVDIEMPRMDGFDLTRNVRGDVRTEASRSS